MKIEMANGSPWIGFLRVAYMEEFCSPEAWAIHSGTAKRFLEQGDVRPLKPLMPEKRPGRIGKFSTQ